MKHQELLHLSLVQARDEIEHLTVTPSELLDAYLERLHEKEPAYNAYVTVHEEAARQAAEGLTGGCRPPPSAGAPAWNSHRAQRQHRFERLPLHRLQ